MPRETWSVHSVKDHTIPFAFVADVLLYDRLLLPIPSPDDMDRWIRRGWEPQRQARIVATLGDRCQGVVWDEQRRERWKSAFAAASATAQETQPDAFKFTRMQLIEELPRRVTGVDTVAAYATIEAFREDAGLETVLDPELGPGLASAAFALEFAVPAQASTTPRSLNQELEILRAVLELSSEKDFQRNRRAFWRMMREFSSGVVTDRDALDDAVEEIRDIVEERNEYVRQGNIDLAVRVGFLATTVTLGLISGPGLPLVAASGAMIAVGQFTWTELQSRRQRPASDEAKVAALFAEIDRDVRDRFFRADR